MATLNVAINVFFAIPVRFVEMKNAIPLGSYVIDQTSKRINSRSVEDDGSWVISPRSERVTNKFCMETTKFGCAQVIYFPGDQ